MFVARSPTRLYHTRSRAPARRRVVSGRRPGPESWISPSFGRTVRRRVWSACRRSALSRPLELENSAPPFR